MAIWLLFAPFRSTPLPPLPLITFDNWKLLLTVAWKEIGDPPPITMPTTWLPYTELELVIESSPEPV